MTQSGLTWQDMRLTQKRSLLDTERSGAWRARARHIIGRSITITAHGCWEWCKSKSKSGYGTACIGDERHQAHRMSFAAFSGQIPKEKLVCHKCDNRSCVNPDHLFLGTHTDNRLDFVAKGRHKLLRGPETYRRGSESHLSKLTDEQVTEVVSLATSGVPRIAIVKRFNISVGYVSDLKCGKWRTEATQIKRGQQ